MSTATIDGLEVRYEVFGSGAPLLLFAPGGFDATIEKWRAASAWTGIDALDALATRFQLIVYDRRSPDNPEEESNTSAGTPMRGRQKRYWISSRLNLRLSWAGAWDLRWHWHSRLITRRRPARSCSTGRSVVFAGKRPVATDLSAITASPAAMVCQALSNVRESAKAFGWIPKPVPGLP